MSSYKKRNRKRSNKDAFVNIGLATLGKTEYKDDNFNNIFNTNLTQNADNSSIHKMMNFDTSPYDIDATTDPFHNLTPSPTSSQENFSDNSNNNSDTDSQSDDNDKIKIDTYLNFNEIDYNKFLLIKERLYIIIKKLKKYKLKINILKTKLNLVVSENNELKTRVEILQQEQDELEGALRVNNIKNIKNNNRSTIEDVRRARREEAKRALFSGADMDEDEAILILGENDSFFGHLYKKGKSWLLHKMPLANDVKKIQARYGLSVSSYFQFYRWVIINFFLLSFIAILFLFGHASRVWSKNNDLQSLFVGARYASVNDSMIAKGINDSSIISIYSYEGSIKHNGMVPYFMQYSSYSPDEKVHYSTLILVCIITLLFIAVSKWVKEDRLRKEIDSLESEQENVKFAKTLLCTWEFGLSDKQEVEEMKISILESIRIMAEEERLSIERKRRNKTAILFLWLRRFIGMILYIICQAIGWSAILSLTFFSKSIQSAFDDNSFLKRTNVAASIVPFSVTLINVIMPVVIKKIISYENWDTGDMIIKQQLWRMFLSKILNVLIQLISFVFLVDPFLLQTDNKYYTAFRDNFGKEFVDTEYPCPFDQSAAGLFQLLFTEFIGIKLLHLTMVYARKLYAKTKRIPWLKWEFQLAKKMVSLLYFMGLVFAILPFCPSTVIFCTGFLILSFKFDHWYLNRYLTKPKRSWKAQDIGSFFIKFYLATLFLIGGASVYFFLDTRTFRKHCDEGIPDDCKSLNDKQADIEKCYWNTCSRSCGAFVYETNAFVPVGKAIKHIILIGDIYALLIDRIEIIWLFVLIIGMIAIFRKNTITVMEDVAADKEKTWEATTQSLEAKLRKQEKLIQKMKLTHNIGNLEEMVEEENEEDI